MATQIELPELQQRLRSVDKLLSQTLMDQGAPTEPQEFLDWLWPLISTCSNCPLANGRNTVVKSDGLASASIMVIGEGPGSLEDLSGLPLVGPLELQASRCATCENSLVCYSNKLLRKPTSWGGKRKHVICNERQTGQPTLPHQFYMRSTGAIVDGLLLKKWKMAYPRHCWLGLHSTDSEIEAPCSPFYICNTTHCRSWDKTNLTDHTPTFQCREACRPWFNAEWAAVNPKAIIALGRVALTFLLRSEDKASQVTNGAWVATKYGPTIFSNHPAYYMRLEDQQQKALGYAKLAKVFERALSSCGFQVEE